MNAKGSVFAIAMGAALAANSPAVEIEAAGSCAIELVVLGAGQDAGAPQIGNAGDDGPHLLPSSLGLIDRGEGARYLFDATPAITQQLAMLDAIEPPSDGSRDRLGLDGVFLTHAHIGHYLGLAYFGREAANTSGLRVVATMRMQRFLRNNGPWSQLVELDNIELPPLQRKPWAGPAAPGEWRLNQLIRLHGNISASPIPVPHRDEYSDTVGWTIYDTSNFSILYMPDIDGWEDWEARDDGTAIEEHIGKFDMLFVDATFWDDNELFDENGVGRDMNAIPHPRVTETMDRLQSLPASERAKVHFIHYNHTNPIRDPDSAESREVAERGFNVARRGDRHCLVQGDIAE